MRRRRGTGLARGAHPHRLRALETDRAASLDAGPGAAPPPLGPNLVTRHEVALRILDATGLDDLTKDLVIDVLHSFLVGALLEAREAREVERVSGLTDEQWFAMAEPALTAQLDAEKFPHVLRLGEAVARRRQGDGRRSGLALQVRPGRGVGRNRGADRGPRRRA